VVCQIPWDQQYKAFPPQCARIALALLRNLGVNVGGDAATRRTFKFVDLTGVANRGFHDRPDQPGPRGWFGGGEDDMRHFPVNRTGIDPVHNVPQPLEPFPEEMLLGGVLFKRINPEENEGRAVVVLGGTEDQELPREVTINLDDQADRLWMLGALSALTRAGVAVVDVAFLYDDGSVTRSPLVAGVHLNGYQFYQEVAQGR
ncbi:unnamed protein product, partial [marine sediment metagenome]